MAKKVANKVVKKRRKRRAANGSASLSKAKALLMSHGFEIKEPPKVARIATSLNLEVPLLKGLKKKSRKHGLSVSAAANEAIRAYLRG